MLERKNRNTHTQWFSSSNQLLSFYLLVSVDPHPFMRDGHGITTSRERRVVHDSLAAFCWDCVVSLPLP